MATAFFLRHRRLVIALQLLLAPFVTWCSYQAYMGGETETEEWLPESFEETQQLKWFYQHFTADDLLAVSWEGSSLEDPHALELAQSLREPISLNGNQPEVLVRQVVVASEVLDQLRDEPSNLPRRVALSRMEGWLLGPEGQAATLIFLSPTGWNQREALLEFIRAKIQEITKLDADEIYLGGTTQDGVAIDQASHKYMDVMPFISYGISMVLMYGLFRSVPFALLVFFNAYFCQQVSLAMVYLSGTKMDNVMLIVPSLVYVLSVSTGVHMINYYRNALTSLPVEQAPAEALRRVFVPSLLSMTTTAIGLVSLLVSSLTPVDKFATFAALGVVASTLILLLVMPAQLAEVSHWIAQRKSPSTKSNNASLLWAMLVTRINQLQIPIVATAVALLILSGWGIFHLSSSARVYDLFRSDQKIVQDYNWMEQNIGPMVPLETVIQFEPVQSEEAPTLLETLRYVSVAHDLIRKQDGIGAVISAASFTPPLARRERGPEGAARESAADRTLNNHIDLFDELGMFKREGEQQLWRISARSYASQKYDYGNILDEVKENLQPVLEKYTEQGYGKATVTVCGGVPLVQKTQRQMMEDLKEGFMFAAALITLMMILLALGSISQDWQLSPDFGSRVSLVLQRVLAGCVAMIPNLLPCMGVFGAMGWLEIPVDIGSMLTASVALGIAVDDTLHFLVSFRRSLAGGSKRKTAVLHAYQHCGTAMIETSLICGLGLFVYAFSPFVPIAQFAWLMFTSLTAALLGDLIVLPALLLSPLGKLFELVKAPKKKPATA